MTTVSHVGHCVEDLERSTRFYTGVFGFEVRDELSVPDELTTDLLAVTAPVGLTARYLTLDGFVLELLWFDRPGNAEPVDRPMTQPGLTHLSFMVDDLSAAAARVLDLGGEVLEGRTVPAMAMMVRDPDGQLIELLAAS